MDIRYSDEEERFRREVRAAFAEMLPAETRERLASGRSATREEIVAWQRALNARGWGVPEWPAEHGGRDWGPIRNYIFFEEWLRLPAPPRLAFGLYMVGPIIYTFGSEAQKRRFLPRIANLDDWWCQGFSEPGAGSDLASLSTKAEKRGDVWVIDGQKTWTTYAQYADWIFVLARTDATAKRQMGISFFLVDMKTPGVTVRPIQTIDGGHEVNEVFFDGVEVPAENLVGEVNKGWDYAKFLLSNERAGIARIGTSKMRVERIKELAAVERRGGRPLIEDRNFRRKLAEVEIELKALEITQLRVVTAEAKRARGQPDPASSILKIKGSQIQQATTELLYEVMGPFAAPYLPAETNEPPIGPDWAAPLAPLYFNTRKVTIYGGSNEIQKNIIAKAVLGL